MLKHLSSLFIQNFRLFKELEVKRLGHVNLIVGPNNTGKSTLLEALSAYAYNADPAVLHALLQRRNEASFAPGDTYLFEKLSFRGLDTDKPLSNRVRIAEDQASIHNSLEWLHWNAFEKETPLEGISQAEIFNPNVFDGNHENHMWRVHADGEVYGSFWAKTVVTNYFHLPLPIKKRLPCRFVSPRIAEPSEELWEDVELNDAVEVVYEGLRLLDPNVRRLVFARDSWKEFPFNNLDEVKQKTRTGKVFLKDKTALPLASFGDGMTRILQILAPTVVSSNGIALIDEIENGLYYGVHTHVWKLLFDLAQKNNIQIFATTHSKDMLEAFNNVANDHALEGEVIRMGRSVRGENKGDIIALDYDETETNAAFASGIDIR
jgi:predicted ATPase